MNINLLVFPTLLLAVLLFYVGQFLFGRSTSHILKISYFIGFFLLSIPGLLFSLFYIHLFDDWIWFYQFRSLPLIEMSAAGAGLLAGALGAIAKKLRLVSPILLIIVLILGIMVPFIKPIFASVPQSQILDRWENGVCMQSTSSSCGPASAATIFNQFGIKLSEAELSKECFTYVGGTENWYLARAFKKRGFSVTYRSEPSFPNDLKFPSIAGVRMNGFGHFIVIMDLRDGIFITADPLFGKEEYSKTELIEQYDFTGFFMEIEKK